MKLSGCTVSLLLWVTFWPVRANACDCATQPVCQSAWTSDIVFVGVVEQNDTTGARIVVEEQFRGERLGQRILIEPTERGVGCSYSFFAVGERYLVFGLKDSSGRWEAHQCGGTSRLEQAAEPLRYIRQALARPGPGRLSGDGFVDIDPGELVRSGPPLAHLRVSLLSASVSLTTVTDAAGRFQFSSVPAGDYMFTVDVPSELEPLPPRRISIGRNACIRHAFWTTKR